MRQWKPILIICLMLFLGAALYWIKIPHLIDLEDAYLPAARAVIGFRSPYQVQGFYSPPWALLPIIPFVWLPVELVRPLFVLVSMMAFFFVARRLGAGLRSSVLLVFSYPVMVCLLCGSLEWLVFLGLLLPPQWAIFLFSIKPHVGAGAIVYLLFDAWRQGRWRRLAQVVWPSAVAYLLSFLVFGFWPARFTDTVNRSSASDGWNATVWPFLIPVGCYFLWQGIRKRDEKLALASSPFFSPYVAAYSWSGILLLMLSEPNLLLLTTLVLWAAKIFSVFVPLS